MKQLELRSYTREEIAEVLSENIKDSKHFKRNVENKLSKWGYRFHYTTAVVEILSKPETPEERLSEILYRGYGIDIQVSAQHFAFFITAFEDIEGFSSMPWGKRADEYYQRYGYSVSDRTLRNWCSELEKRGVVSIGGGSSKWVTLIENGRKIRKRVEECDEKAMQEYYDRRREIFQANYDSLLKENIQPKEAKLTAWKKTYSDMWSEFSCCYYYCNNVVFSAFSNNGIDVFEIYELAREIAPPVLNTEPKLVKAQDQDLWGF